jgi:lysine 2,3-aminomutase
MMPTRDKTCRSQPPDFCADLGALITTPDHLPDRLCPDCASLTPVVQAFPMRINRYFLARIESAGDVLARQVLPDVRELRDPCADWDPLAEELQSPAPQIIHRYPGRVLFLVSNQCALYCRFCMRKRRVGSDARISPQSIQAGLRYIHRHREINEVILSGGDPLMLSDDKLAEILTALKASPHVRVLRIHTRIPSAWPQRITPALAKRLSAFHPLFVMTHCNHPAEITPATERACALLADAGIPLGSQTVLLKDVNDRPETLQQLAEALLAIRVRPYYLHQIDRVPGTAHFQVPLEAGLAILNDLRGRLSGMAVPRFMIDLPGGGGKIELLPDAIIQKNSDHWMVRNFEGRIYRYPTGPGKAA